MVVRVVVGQAEHVVAGLRDTAAAYAGRRRGRRRSRSSRGRTWSCRRTSVSVPSRLPIITVRRPDVRGDRAEQAGRVGREAGVDAGRDRVAGPADRHGRPARSASGPVQSSPGPAGLRRRRRTRRRGARDPRCTQPPAPARPRPLPRRPRPSTPRSVGLPPHHRPTPRPPLRCDRQALSQSRSARASEPAAGRPDAAPDRADWAVPGRTAAAPRSGRDRGAGRWVQLAVSSTSRLRVTFGSTGMPGPIVVAKVTFLRYLPLAADGLARSTSSSTAA